MPLLQKDYSDINLSFAIHPVTGDIAKLTGSSAVKRAVQNLVLTNFYERPFQPTLGCGVQQTMFEPMTAITAIKIQNIITGVIDQYEPRVSLDSVVVQMDTDHNGYRVDITFHIVNISEIAQLSLFLERVR